MTQQKIFIFPTQFNRLDAATKYGLLMGRWLNKPVELLGAISIPTPIIPEALVGQGLKAVPSVTYSKRQNEAEEQLQQLQQQAKKIWHKVDWSISVGVPYQKILHRIKIDQPEVLILQKQHPFNLLNKWMGTFETDLAKDADCPVLVIPQEQRWLPVIDILYVTDNLTEEIQNIYWLINIARISKGKIGILEARKDNQESKQKLQEIRITAYQKWDFQGIGYLQVAPEKKMQQLEEFASVRSTDWLAFQGKNKGFVEEWFGNDSVTSKVLQNDLPVIVF